MIVDEVLLTYVGLLTFGVNEFWTFALVIEYSTAFDVTKAHHRFRFVIGGVFKPSAADGECFDCVPFHYQAPTTWYRLAPTSREL